MGWPEAFVWVTFFVVAGAFFAFVFWLIAKGVGSDE